METDLEQLATTKSGSVRKQDAMNWLETLDKPDEEELLAAVTPKPTDHSGSTYPTPISTIRVTGAPDFVETVAGLFQWFLNWETSATLLNINLQQIEDRDTGDMTGNYALYISAAVRGNEGAMSRALLGEHREEDRKLVDALDKYGGDR